MKKFVFIFAWLIFVFLWSVLFYQFLAPAKGTQQILLLSAESLFYSLIWGVFISLFQRLIGWKGYGMLLIPVAIMIVFIVGIDRSNFLFMLGLVIISELISLAKIFAHNRTLRSS